MKIGKMKPKWTKVGNTERDLFDVLDMVTQGKTIGEIAKKDRRVSVDEIQQLLSRTKSYLKSHLILDCYLETANRLPEVKLKIGWGANEVRELVELHINGASIKSISILMRKNKTAITKKLESLNLL